jgi:hypothetical protein
MVQCLDSLKLLAYLNFLKYEVFWGQVLFEVKILQGLLWLIFYWISNLFHQFLCEACIAKRLTDTRLLESYVSQLCISQHLLFEKKVNDHKRILQVVTSVEFCAKLLTRFSLLDSLFPQMLKCCKKINRFLIC